MCRYRGGVPCVDNGARRIRTYCECDLSSMRDFLGENAEKVQDARQRCWICAESADDIFEDVLPFCHLNCQIGQTNAQLQSNRFRARMKRRQIPHNRGAEVWELCAGHLVEVVYDLPLLEGTSSWMRRPTLPLSVVAANSLAAASAEFDSSIASVVVHASCYPFRQPACSHVSLCHSTYRLLELFQEKVCLLLLRAVRSRLHSIVRCQHRLEDMLHAVGRHGGSVRASSGGREADAARRRGDGGMSLYCEHELRREGSGKSKRRG